MVEVPAIGKLSYRFTLAWLQIATPKVPRGKDLSIQNPKSKIQNW
jgi:hypothetical protein